MPSQTIESALEVCIERHLTGGTTVDTPGGYLAAGSEEYQTSKGAGLYEKASLTAAKRSGVCDVVCMSAPNSKNCGNQALIHRR
jgi:hypothetical protein